MKVLTTPSQDGNGFAVDSADLANTICKLGKIEWKSFDLLDEICQHRCRHEHDAHKKRAAACGSLLLPALPGNKTPRHDL